MTWVPQSHEDYDALKGFDVYSADDEKIGTIRDVFHPRGDITTSIGKHYFRVEPGMIEGLFTDVNEVYVPERMVRQVDPDEDRVILEVPKDSLKQQNWHRPADLDTYRRS
jgi:hypothetical protein